MLVPSTPDMKELTEQTRGQAQNSRWHTVRVGKLTSSMFASFVRCVKPEGVVRQVLYPGASVHSEALAYDRRQ